MTINGDGYLLACTTNSASSLALVTRGDIALVRRAEQKLIADGTRARWCGGLDLFRQADITIGNLESPISDRGAPFKNYPPVFRSDPEVLSFLVGSGFDVVSLANNHILDYGPDVLLDTMHRLSEGGVHCFGAGPNQDMAQRPTIIERSGIKLGFLGFTEWGPFGKDGEPGPARYTQGAVLSRIADLRSHVDLVIVSLHLGFEFVDYPMPHHVASCRRFIDAGAHIVLGHHPHQPHGVEVYRQGLIAYSLGNFLFDMGDPAPKATREVLVLRLGLAKDGVTSAQIIPFHMGNDLSLRILEGAEKSRALDYYRRLSIPLQDPRRIQREWYNTIRRYVIVYTQTLWQQAVRQKQMSFLLRFIRLFFASPANRRLLTGFVRFLMTGY